MIARIIKDSSTSLKDAEAKYKAAELMSALADTKTELANVQEALQGQQRQIRELSEQLKFAGNMEFERPFYWNKSGDQKDGPFCPGCWDHNKKAIRLHGYNDNWWRCTVCKDTFESNRESGDPYRNFRR